MRKTENIQKIASFACLFALKKVFEALRKDPETEKKIAEILKPDKAEEKEESKFARIRCPLCRWQPTASSRWFCSDIGHPEYFFDGCGTCWNTFETRGRCPGCSYQWKWTSCLQCWRFSRHEDWYERKSSEKK